MSKYRRKSFTLSLLLAMLACTAQSAPDDSPSRENVTREFIRVARIKRYFTVHVPDKMDDKRERALLVILHGGAGDIDRMMDAYGTELVKLAHKDGAIAVVPEAIQKHWNDGREFRQSYFLGKKKDDIGFFRALLSEMKSRYKIDDDRIYFTGVSNGGMMTFRVALEMKDDVAAIAAIVAGLPDSIHEAYKDSDAAGRPSVLIMNGTSDEWVPWDGGFVRALGDSQYGKVVSAVETVRFWVKRCNAAAIPKVSDLPDRSKKDGTTATRAVHAAKSGGSPVILYTIKGGGHTVPNTGSEKTRRQQKLAETMFGKQSADFDAAEIVWKFLRSKGAALE